MRRSPAMCLVGAASDLALRSATLLVLAFVARSDVRAEPVLLQAGTANVDITPEPHAAFDLAGRPLAPRDTLYARVLTLDDGAVRLAVVSVDLIVFASPRVAAEAKRRFNLDHVIQCATHTHAGAAPRGLWIQPPTRPDWTRDGRDPAAIVDWDGLSADPWYASVEEKIVGAIGEALRTAFPARLVAGKSSYVGAYMAHNRRLVRPDGGVTALWENPDRRPTQPVDPTVGVIRVDDATGKLRALAVHYACHPVATMGAGAVSRDFPGAMADYVEQQAGPDCLAMFLQGASGDLDPYDLHNLRGENRFNVPRQAGISLGRAALRTAEDLDRTSVAAAGAIRIDASMVNIPHRRGGGVSEVGVSTVVIGRDLALTAVPGEPFVRHQLDLTARSPAANTFLLGLAYHGRGSPFVIYLPTAQAVREGGYGATECSFLAADAGATLVGRAIEQLRNTAHAAAPVR